LRKDTVMRYAFNIDLPFDIEVLLEKFLAFLNEKNSIGIIGGADGPTSVFVASSVLHPIVAAIIGISSLLWLVASIIATVLIIRHIIKKYKKQP